MRVRDVKPAAPHATYQTKGVHRALSFHRHPPHRAREDAMSIIRLIHIKIDPSEVEKATRIWKTECASLMIRQKGCVSEKLLRCRDAPECTSYSEWDSDAAIEAYRNSDAHKEIVRHTRGLKGAKAEVKLYELVQ